MCTELTSLVLWSDFQSTDTTLIHSAFIFRILYSSIERRSSKVFLILHKQTYCWWIFILSLLRRAEGEPKQPWLGGWEKKIPFAWRSGLPQLSDYWDILADFYLSRGAHLLFSELLNCPAEGQMLQLFYHSSWLNIYQEMFVRIYSFCWDAGISIQPATSGAESYRSRNWVNSEGFLRLHLEGAPKRGFDQQDGEACSAWGNRQNIRNTSLYVLWAKSSWCVSFFHTCNIVPLSFTQNSCSSNRMYPHGSSINLRPEFSYWQFR